MVVERQGRGLYFQRGLFHLLRRIRLLLISRILVISALFQIVGQNLVVANGYYNRKYCGLHTTSSSSNKKICSWSESCHSAVSTQTLRQRTVERARNINNLCWGIPSLNELRGGSSTELEEKVEQNGKAKRKKSRKVRKQVKTLDWSSSTKSSKGRTTLSSTDHHLKGDALDDVEDEENDITDHPFNLTISCVTWNLAEKSPTEEQSSFLKHLKATSDVIFLSAQECENIQPRRSEGHRSREWRRLCMHHIGGGNDDFVPVAMYSLGGLQASLFVRRRYIKSTFSSASVVVSSSSSSPRQRQRQRQRRRITRGGSSMDNINHIFIQDVKLANVACGIGNAFHNKGAIGVFLTFKKNDGTNSRSSKIKGKTTLNSNSRNGQRHFLFVAAHMAAHVKNVEGRNDDFWRITRELQAQAPPSFLRSMKQQVSPRVNQQRRSSSTSDDQNSDTAINNDFYDLMDYVFFCGDLNYRIELPREVTEHAVVCRATSMTPKEKTDQWSDLSSLLRHDQLLQQMAQRRVFFGFREPRITFDPTFKLDGGGGTIASTDVGVAPPPGRYDSSAKQRVPAWTDRILFHTSSSSMSRSELLENDSEKPSPLKVIRYESIPNACHSDHRPVVGTFQCHI